MKIMNPILKGFNPDPSMCRVGEDYYIATSTFEWFPGVQIHHSKDLVNWQLVSQPLNTTDLLDMRGNPDSGGVWAPQLSYQDGKFWLIYSDVKVVEGNTWKDGYNYLTTCDTIDGEWSRPIYLNGSGFDPSLFHDEDGRKYLINMLWDPRVGNHQFYGIVLQEYDHTEKKLIGNPEIIFKGTEWGLVEAPHLYKMNGYYYLLTAEGGTKYEHQATIARSKDLRGPYEVHPGNPLITSYPYPDIELQKAGHASIVETQNGEWYLAHLTGRPIRPEDMKLAQGRGFCPLGRETALQKLYWENDWPYVLGGNKPSLEIEAPDLPEQKWETNYLEKDDFDSANLNIHFQTLRIPFNEDIGSLEDRSGYLRLYGRESFHSLFTQSFVARRWQSFEFEAETKVEFNPESFQQQAGLVCYYNTRNWTSLHLTWNEQKGKVLDLVNCEKFITTRPIAGNEISVPEGVEEVYLKVNVNKKFYQYSYSFDGETWHKIEVRFDSYKLSDDYIEQAGFFTGAFVGMSCIDTSGRRKHADFDYFRYKEM
ncbi:glycoside hydrolase family 43 protein [Jeotgalibaca ciconiae]|uniref:Glycoside hydrolase family 43 protein n=1 Tax=Jeotgalibaca ciconiae TaxID=2496265 RepID=A0A3S9H848_9LACT|nr:glycoside hydrolase family 43 protein [Jeotgalibaca ciconiae]AZP03539.1 glycoside hydrolase family 43 protein [Jeotgalibaca ciconiae]